MAANKDIFQKCEKSLYNYFRGCPSKDKILRINKIHQLNRLQNIEKVALLSKNINYNQKGHLNDE